MTKHTPNYLSMRNSCQIDIYLLVTTRLVKMTNIPTMCWWCCLTQTGELISSNFVLFWQQTTTSTLSLSMVTLGKVNVSRAEVGQTILLQIPRQFTNIIFYTLFIRKLRV